MLRFLERKMRAGEISPEECKEVLKEMMLRAHRVQQAELASNKWKTWADGFRSKLIAGFGKFLTKPPSEPSLGMEELSGTIRSRRL